MVRDAPPTTRSYINVTESVTVCRYSSADNIQHVTVGNIYCKKYVRFTHCAKVRERKMVDNSWD